MSDQSSSPSTPSAPTLHRTANEAANVARESSWLPTPAEALDMVLQNWWLLLLVGLVGCAAAVMGALLFRPVYETHSLLELKPPSQARVGQAAGSGEDSVAAAAADPLQVVQRIKAGLATKAVIVPIFDRYEEYFTPKERTKRRVDTMIWLADQISVDHRGGHLYSLSCRSKNAKLSQLINRDLATEALHLYRADFEQAAIRSETFATQQLTELSAAIKKLEDRMVTFLRKHPSLTVESLDSERLTIQGADRLRAAASHTRVVARSLDNLAHRSPTLRNLLRRQEQLKVELRDLERGAPTTSSGVIRSLAEIKQQLAELRGQGKTAAHPLVKQLERRRADLERRLAHANPGARSPSSNLEKEVRAKLKQVASQINSEARKLAQRGAPSAVAPADRAQLEAEWADLRRDHMQKSDEYTRMQEVAVNASLKKNLQLYEARKLARVVEPAPYPDKPTGLTRPIIMAAGVVGSLLLGLVAAMLLGVVDPTIRRPRQIAKTKLPLLAVLAHHPGSESDQKSLLSQQRLVRLSDAQDAAITDGGSVIRWLKRTDDLDTALDLLAPETDNDGLRQADTITSATMTALVPSDDRLSNSASDVAFNRSTAAPMLRVWCVPSDATLNSSVIAAVEPHSEQTESIRKIAAKLQANASGQLQVVVVASWEPEVGKTMLAANLATVLAESHKRVLAIDACPGRPGLTCAFGLEPNGIGISEQLQRWLDGNAEPWDVVQITPTLAVLPASSTTRPMASLLSSEALAQLIKDTTQLFDVLVVDTQALQVASDAVVLQQRADGYVTVAERHRSTTVGLRHLTSRVDASRVLGVVLNQCAVRPTANLRRLQDRSHRQA